MKSFLFFVCTSVLGAQVVQPPSSAVFEPDAVHEIRLTFKQADWFEQLTAIYAEFRDNTPYIEGSLEWGPYKFDSVGVRFKGNSSYSGATTRKKPFRIKLNEFVKGQKIDGMASFGLSNGWNDPSFVREKPYYELAATAGLAAPRSNFAALYVNDEYWGLYILGEIVNGDFLKNHFAKGDDGGNLYKASDPGANLAYLGDDPASYQRFFSKESNEDANDWTDLIELARVFDQTPAAELPAKLESLIDVDSFLTALALDNLTVNLDSYVGMAQNYYLYRRPSDKKWVWIPWDPSLAFGAFSQGGTGQSLRDLPLEWVQTTAAGGGGAFPGGGVPPGGGIPPGGGVPPGGGAFPGALGGTGRPIATKLWEVPEYKSRYREIYQRLVEQVFVPAQVVARMEALRDMIRPWVEKDTQKLVTLAQFEAAVTGLTTGPQPGAPGAPAQGGFGLGNSPALQPLIDARLISVTAQLAGRPSPVVSATPASLVTAQVAGSAAGSQEISIAVPDGTPQTTYTAAASAPWLALTNPSATLPGKVAARINGGTLAAGSYNASISITAPNTTNSPLAIPVTLIVTAAPAVVANPSSLAFSAIAGQPQGPGGGGFPGGLFGGAPLSIQVLSTAGASPFSITVTDSTCGNFLTLNPASGTTPAAVAVTANTAGTTGTCTARLNISSSGLATATVPVTLTTTTIPTGGGLGGPPRTEIE